MRAINEDQCHQDPGFLGQPEASDLRAELSGAAQARAAARRAPAQIRAALRCPGSLNALGRCATGGSSTSFADGNAGGLDHAPPFLGLGPDVVAKLSRRV